MAQRECMRVSRGAGSARGEVFFDSGNFPFGQEPPAALRVFVNGRCDCLLWGKTAQTKLSIKRLVPKNARLGNVERLGAERGNMDRRRNFLVRTRTAQSSPGTLSERYRQQTACPRLSSPCSTGSPILILST